MVDRFFLPPGADVRRGVVHLDSAESEHAIKSRRLRTGDAVELLDGLGLVASGRLAATSKSGCTVEIDHYQICERDRPEVHLALSAPRGPRMDDLVDRINQLGVWSITPVVFTRSVAAREDTSPARIDRWRRIAREASKQSGEPFVTEIRDPLPLDVLVAAPFRGKSILLHPAPDAPSFQASLADLDVPVRILVGPEGGILDEEIALATSRGEALARLGRAMLRIETAAIAACAIARLR
jgi:16S rRNA (uracil1498-N3)-methyltransferase